MHAGGESATSGFREQMAWQLRAARVLTDLLERGAREGLPVLEWTISHTGAQLTGRSYAQPGAARRAALAAWAAALGIKLRDEYHQDSRMTTITGTANRERTRHGFATITLTGDIWEGLTRPPAGTRPYRRQRDRQRASAHRPVATRYNKLAVRCEATVHIAAINEWLRPGFLDTP